MAEITPQTIEFVKKCAKDFNEDIKRSTFRDDDYIGLRSGFNDNCINVFELGNEVGFFSGYMDKATDKEKIDYAIYILQGVLNYGTNDNREYFIERFNEKCDNMFVKNSEYKGRMNK